ncbi:MAG: 3-isopropylmalate dehydratase small subunit [Candidimonas sp.]|nr:MAG: 3-isopropylmalate dehydratase small subunit [Candidimonas sp.]TAM22769.1 MAG: 3-isopropylmalate dehydratase small subunit [Candidimonas sp.]
MEPLLTLESTACALPFINIDTDQIFPARYMKQPRSVGYQNFLFHELRRCADGELDKSFALNDPRNRDARILIARRNFGSGSSREAAVYALIDQGVRCVLAPSFGDIFASNSVNNGLLPACIDEDDIETLLGLAAPGGVKMAVDLQAGTVEAQGRVFTFRIDSIWRLKLLNGWDDIDITCSYEAAINAWLSQDADARPWAALCQR